jgi:hypothetical protein
MKTFHNKGIVFYTFRPSKEGQPPFTDVKLPSGMTIRQVDQTLHQKALANAAKALRERFDSR